MIAYLVILKDLIPVAIENTLHVKLPFEISTSATGQVVWAAVLSFGVILPLSIPRSLAAAKYSNLLCFGFMLYFVAAVVFVCLFNRMLVPDLGSSLYTASFTHQQPIPSAVVSCIPIVIFSLMF